MSSYIQGRGDADIDLPRLGKAVWARRVAVAATVLLAGAAAFGIASAVSPLYRGEVRIIIEERQAAVSGADATGQSVIDDQAIASQVEVIRSSDLLRQVIEETELGKVAEFDPAMDPSFLTGMLVAAGLAEDPMEEASQDRVLREVRKKLEVYQVRNSRVIGIEFSSRDPDLAAEVANALARVYMSFQSGAKLASNALATAWLEPEIQELRTRVREAEAAVADFRAEKGLFSVGQDGSLAARQLTDLSSELSAVRRERADAEARAATVRDALDNGRPTDAISSVLESSLIQRLRERQIAIQGEIADLSTTLLNNHPRIRGLRSQLAGLETQIREEVRKALASLESDAEVARRRENELEAQLNLLKAASVQAESDEVELRALQREAAAARELLETYLARYRAAVSRGDPDALPADARIISEANVPSEPYFPKTLPIVIVAMFGAGLVHIIVIMLAELLSGRALKPAAPAFSAAEGGMEDAPAPETLETSGIASAGFLQEEQDQALPATVNARPQGEAPPAAVAPVTLVAASREGEAGIDAEEEFSVEAVAEALMARRASLVVGLAPEGDAAVLGSADLARMLSAAGRRVLYIDMTANGSPGAAMAGRGLPGITELLCGEIAIADAIHADRTSSVDVIPLGEADFDRAMRAASRIGMVVEALGDAYDMVIAECGAARMSAVRHLFERRSVDVVLSILEPEEAMVEAELKALVEDGYPDALMLLVDDNPPEGRLSGSVA